MERSEDGMVVMIMIVKLGVVMMMVRGVDFDEDEDNDDPTNTTATYYQYRTVQQLISSHVTLSMSARGLSMLALLFSTTAPLTTISSTI
jgi:hypothetical protein